MQRYLLILILLVILPGLAPAADRHLEVTDFYVYPDEESDFNKLAGFAWPDVTGLNVLISVDIGGFRGEEKLNIFLVLFDEDENVIHKDKGKHYLPPGEHDLVFADFISTADVLGERSFTAKIEVSLKGVKPVKDAVDFTVEGPDPPDVELFNLELRNPATAYGQTYYDPGDEFIFQGYFEIEDNESNVEPEIIIYAMMEEDFYHTDPDYEYQPYGTHWDSRVNEGGDGVYMVTARGRLPYYYAEPYDRHHPFRLYLIVDFGWDVIFSDYVRDEVYDDDTGEHRKSDELDDRLIELDPAQRWDIRRVRGGRPWHHRWGE